MNQKPVAPNSLPIPPEIKPEHYERRKCEAVFHRLDLCIEFAPGHNRVGAIVKRFINGIPNHDAMVKKVEEKWAMIDEVSSILKKKNRLFRNLDAAYNSLLTKPEEYEEYLDLVPRMKNVELRLQTITDPEAKAKVESEYIRFKALDGTYKPLLALQESLRAARDDRDVTRDELLELEAQLVKLKEEERNLSLKISDDHIVADERGVFVGELFPNVQGGMILTSFNLLDTEPMDYDVVMSSLKSLKPPHRAVFQRYDMKLDPFLQVWKPLGELRDSGVYIEDPRIARVAFVEACAQGDVKTVTQMILQGEDINAFDYAKVSAVHAAAVNGKADILDMLHTQKAEMNSRDKNMMTPLLACIKRGLMDMVRLLLDYHADRTATDRLHRGALYYAVESGNINLVKLFLKREIVNIPDEYWGYTPLHLAAHKGYTEIVVLLLDTGASFYRKSKKNETAEEVSADAKHTHISHILRDERLQAPAQLVYTFHDTNVGYWVGDHTALNPIWRIETNITHCICFLTPGQRAPPRPWTNDPDHMQYHPVVLNIPDDDDVSRESWNTFQAQLGNILTIFRTSMENLENSQILICDPTGVSTAAAVLVAYFVARKQFRMNDVIEACTVARPSISISLSLRRGLDQLQRAMDEKKLKRLDDKVRNSVAMSVGF